MPGLTQRIATLAASLAALAAGASPTFAATASLSPDGRYLDIVETTPGEENWIEASPTVDGSGTQVIDVWDTLGATPGAGCVRLNGTTIRCTGPAEQVRVHAGAGNDRVQARDGAFEFGAGVLSVDLGDGDDIYTAEEERGQAIVSGGAGNDRIDGGERSDTLDGGPGDDTLHGFEGADVLHGGEGQDTLTGDAYSDKGVFSDVIDGGPGRDAVDDFHFSGEPTLAPAIDVSLDGAANDGRPGENDNITGVEIIMSGSAGSFSGDDAANEFVAPQVGAAGTLLGLGGDDVLIAGDASGDVVDGGAGADTVEGGFGDDRLVGGPGRDILNGDRKTRCNELACDILVAGNDTIEARDGEIDSVTCGTGSDRVIADPVDVVAADCELVERTATTPPGDGAAPGGKKPTVKARLSVPRVKLAVALRRGLKITVTGATGKVTLRATRAKRTVARGAGTAKRGKAVVTLRFTKAARRSLSRTRRVKLTIRGAGTTRTLTLKR